MTKPIPMVLNCPVCGSQHIDAPEPEIGWTNPPHKSHLCHHCETIWRPTDVPTNGVKAVATRGKADTWPTLAQLNQAATTEAVTPSNDIAGTFACPICGRDYPHSAIQHEQDKEWLLSLLREARHYAQLFINRNLPETSKEAELFVKRVGAAQVQIQQNETDRPAGKLSDIGGGNGSYAAALSRRAAPTRKE